MEKNGSARQGATLSPVVPAIVALGVPLNMAVLCGMKVKGYTLSTWAEENGHSRAHVSRLINKWRPRAPKYASIRESLCHTLGIDREWLDSQIDG